MGVEQVVWQGDGGLAGYRLECFLLLLKTLAILSCVRACKHVCVCVLGRARSEGGGVCKSGVCVLRGEGVRGGG